MTENRKTPKLRFKGFTDAWEQRKLSEVLSSYTDPVEIPRTGYERLGIRSHAKGTFHNFVPAGHELQTAQMHRVAADKFIVNITFGWEHAVAVTDENDAGKLVSHRFPQFSLSEELDPKFLKFIILDEDFRHHLWLASPGGAGRNRVLNINEMLQYEIMIPNVPEQRKIARMLIDLDNLITLHQRKLDRLKNIKKSMLDKMFPKDGEVVPEIRFKGFTDAWEQRKFLDLLDTQNGIRRGPFGSSLKKDSFVKKSDYVVYEQQNAIYDNYVTRYFISKEKYNELIRFNIQPGDFIMSGAGTIGRISMVPDGIKKGVFNQALIRFKVDKNSVNPLYFLKFMQSDMMQKQLTQANPGSAMTNLVPMDELKKWDVTIPSLEEQNKISNFINQIDESITLHQRKLERLQEVKKGLLQKMFV